MKQGSIATYQKKEAGNVPPFPINAANNGLSVDPITGLIVLGQAIGQAGDPAQLLSNREIPLNNFSFTLGQAADRKFIVDENASIYQLGDIDSTGNSNRLSINDNTSVIELGTVPFASLRIDSANQHIILGDVYDNNLGSMMDFDLLTSRFQVFDDNHSYIDIAPAIGQFIFGNMFAPNDLFFCIDTIAPNAMTATIGTGTFPPAQFKYLNIDLTNNLYQLGDIDVTGNGTQISVDDTTGVIQLGDVTGSLLNTVLAVTPTTLIFANVNGDYLSLNPAGNLYGIGDLLASNNGTLISIRDGSNQIEMENAANNAKIRMNGVAGFTGTKTPVVSITVNGGIVTNVT